MRRNLRALPHQGAMGTPLGGDLGKKKVARPKVLHVVAIVASGLIAAWATHKLPGYVPTIVASTTILGAFIYWHHKDPRLAVTVATWPVVAVGAFALAADQRTKAATRAVSQRSDMASAAFGGGILDLLDSGKELVLAFAQQRPSIAGGVGAVLLVAVLVWRKMATR